MQLLADIGALLQAQSLGTVGTDIWLGEMQPEPDDAIGLFETPGGTPEVFDHTDYLSLQVRVRSLAYPSAKTRIDSVYHLLHGLHETTLSGTRYHLIAARQPPFSLGQGDRERHELVCNFRVIVRNAARAVPSGQ